MSAIVVRTGYLVTPDCFVNEEAKPSESLIQRLTRRRLDTIREFAAALGK